VIDSAAEKEKVRDVQTLSLLQISYLAEPGVQHAVGNDDVLHAAVAVGVGAEVGGLKVGQRALHLERETDV
jgi:hypothetical protein